MTQETIYSSRGRVVLMTGLATALCAAGPILLLVVAEVTGLLESDTMVGIVTQGAAIAILLAAGWLWGAWLAHILKRPDRKRILGVAGVLGLFPPMLILVGLLAALNETRFFYDIGIAFWSFYQQFTLFFVISTFINAALSALVASLALKQGWRSVLNAVLVGLVAALVSLAVNQLMIAAGFRVGSPVHRGLAETLAPMPTIMVLALFFSGLAGGGLLGWLLARGNQPAAEQIPVLA